VEKFKNITTCVYNILPPARNDAKNIPDYPFLGTESQRKEFTHYMNEKLKEMCKKYDYLFVDVFSGYHDDEGLLITKLSDGHVHIVEHTHLQNVIIEDILKNNIYYNTQ